MTPLNSGQRFGDRGFRVFSELMFGPTEKLTVRDTAEKRVDISVSGNGVKPRRQREICFICKTPR